MTTLSAATMAALLFATSIASANGPTQTTCDQNPRCYARDLALTLTRSEYAVTLSRVIDFEPGRLRVYSKSREKLQALAQSWKQRSDWSVITIHGYAAGSADLAQRRADKIRGYLIRYGVPPDLIVAIGQTGGATVDVSIELCRPDTSCRRTATASR